MLKNLHVYIVTHELTVTGAPRVCAELALLLEETTDAVVTLAVDGATLRGTAAGADAGLGLEPAALAARRLARLIPNARISLDLDATVESAVKADIVIVSTVAPIQLEWMRRFRLAAPSHGALVWWVHEGESVMRQWPADFTAMVADAMTRGLANAIIFPSYSAEVWWRGVAAGRAMPPLVRALPWGLPRWREDAFGGSDAPARGAAMRVALGIPSNAIIFLVVASYNPLKGHRGIAKAFRRAQSSCSGRGGELHLVTAGIERGAQPHYFPQEDMAWVRSDPTVHLLGESNAVPDLLAAADVYVSNTLDGGETWGLANLEALAAGVPVLASRVGGALEMLRDGETALLHDLPRSVDDTEEFQLAAHMCRLVNDEALRADLGARGRVHARSNYGQSCLEESIADTFGALLKLPQTTNQWSTV